MAVSKTLSEYVTQIRRYLSETDAANSFWSNAFLYQIFNEVYLKRCSELIMAYEGFFTNVKYYDVVGGVAKYDWPEGFERLTKLEIVRSDGRTMPLSRFERHEEANVPAVAGGDTYYPMFRPFQNGFVLEPTPDTGTNTSSTFATILLDFNDKASNYTAGTDTTLSSNKQNFRQGTASLQLNKTAITVATNFVDRQVDPLIDMQGKYLKFDVYIPSTIDLSEVALHISTVANFGTASYYEFDTFVNGWNTFTADIDNEDDAPVGGSCADFNNVEYLRFIFTFDNNNEREGFLVDNLIDTGSSLATSYITQLRLEYNGTPAELSSTDRLHPDFPMTYAPLLVYDTVLGAIDAESYLEGGAVRTIQRRRDEWEIGWERYIDNRMVTPQSIRPFIGAYEDA